LVQSMMNSIAHRGPDGEGLWLSTDATVAMGHRRLSVLDLSAVGRQPIEFADRYTMVFNGEIYNYLELREELERKGYSFCGNGDTEVLIALYHEKGEDALSFLDGMFAFSVYDSFNHTLFCARDRFGEKPFYYAFDTTGRFYFASEMKALWAAGFSREADLEMVYLYISGDLVENPADHGQTFYAAIRKLPAGSSFTLTVGQTVVAVNKYWQIDPSLRHVDITPSEAEITFQNLFRKSLARRTRSHVKLGSSLSGGLDSSLIVGELRRLLGPEASLSTFSAQFPGFKRDESYFQELVIRRHFPDAHVVKPTANSLLAHLDFIGFHQEEPFGSASICVQNEVFALAKSQSVVVLLDGQGADEVFAGYSNYLAPFYRGLPIHMAEQARRDHIAIHGQAPNTLKDRFKSFLPQALQNVVLSRNRRHYSGEAYLRKSIRDYGASRQFRKKEFSSLQEALYYSTFCYGLETLLRFADRNSMAHSVEVRLPFLSHELVEFAFSLPDALKIRSGWSKWLIRKAGEDSLPAEVAWRKDKIGYEPPQGQWLSETSAQKLVLKCWERLGDSGVVEGRPKSLSPAFQWKLLSLASTVYHS
jgi:asparagine synthase (glutamine-hydrolysing)